jgi:hypothetical protein
MINYKVFNININIRGNIQRLLKQAIRIFFNYTGNSTVKKEQEKNSNRTEYIFASVAG